MLRELVLGHYKPFREVQRARCAPITLVVGRNSSGKSSVLGAIDLLRPSYASHYGLWLETREDCKWLFHRHDTSQPMELGCALSSDEGTFSIVYSYRLAGDTAVATRLAFEGTLDGQEPVSFDVPLQLSEARDRVEATIPTECVASVHRRETKRKGDVLRQMGILVADLPPHPTPATLVFEPHHAREPACELLWPEDSLPEGLNVPPELLSIFGAAWTRCDFEELNSAFASLRDFPHVAAPPLRPNPESLENEIPSPSALNRINDAMGRLGIWYRLKLQSFPNEKKGRVEQGLRIHDRQLRTTTRLAHVGMGISQVLGILLKAFGQVSDPEMLTVQQPELHLHPHAQGHFADLMIDVVKGEIPGPRQWIVETHSEAMISRIQRRVRDGRLMPEQVSILYVESTPNGAEIQELRLNEDGEFLDEWPGGFFEERYRDSLGLPILREQLADDSEPVDESPDEEQG